MAGNCLFFNLVSESLEGGLLEFRIGKLGIGNNELARKARGFSDLRASGLRFASPWLGVMASGLVVRKGAGGGRGITAFRRLANQQLAMRGLAAVWFGLLA